jgi:hypothetical protein
MASDSEKHAAVLTEHNPLELIKALPKPVFPISMRIGLSPRRSEDSTDAEYRKPNYPVSINRLESAYIPETTIHFDNPVERAPDGKSIWRPTEFAEKLSEILSHLSDVENVDTDQLALSSVSLAKIPVQYLTTDEQTGDTVAKPSLYERNAEATIGRFDRIGTLNATAVRDTFAEALPGETRTPTRLVQVEEVTMKQSRQGRGSAGQSSTTRYYTEADAENVDDLSKTPAVYGLPSTRSQSDGTRPLSPILSSLDSMFPILVGETDLLEIVKFRGRMASKQTFHAEEVQR